MQHEVTNPAHPIRKPCQKSKARESSSGIRQLLQNRIWFDGWHWRLLSFHHIQCTKKEGNDCKVMEGKQNQCKIRTLVTWGKNNLRKEEKIESRSTTLWNPNNKKIFPLKKNKIIRIWVLRTLHNAIPIPDHSSSFKTYDF